MSTFTAFLLCYSCRQMGRGSNSQISLHYLLGTYRACQRPKLHHRSLWHLNEDDRVRLSSNRGIYCTRSTEGSSPVAVYGADSEQLLQIHSQLPGSQDEEQELGNRGLNSHISEILPPQLKRQDPKKINKITKGAVLTRTFVIWGLKFKFLDSVANEMYFCCYF